MSASSQPTIRPFSLTTSSTSLTAMASSTRSPPRLGHDPSRDAILATSSKGWSPLQIKRADSPSKPSSSTTTTTTTPLRNAMDITTSTGPRRTSSSFKHVKHNSLVSNSPFKSGGGAAMTTIQGRPLSVDSGVRKVSGTANGVGLGISARSSRERGGSGSGSGSDDSARKSREASVPSAVPEGRESESPFRERERQVSGGALQSFPHQDLPASHHNDTSPHQLPPLSFPQSTGDFSLSADSIKTKDGLLPRQSMGLKALGRNGLVTSSPFVQSDRSPEKPGIRQNSNSPTKRLTESPIRSAASNSTRYASPSQPARPDVFSSPSDVKASSADFSPTPASLLSSHVSRPSAESSPSRAAAAPTMTPTRSSITSRHRLRGPRKTGSDSPSMTRQQKTVTFDERPDVKEFETEGESFNGEESFEYSQDEEEAIGEEDESMEDVDMDSHDAVGRNTYYDDRSASQEHDSRYTASTLTEQSYLAIPRHQPAPRSNSLTIPQLDEAHLDAASPSSIGHGTESMTADFLDGYFDPSPAMASEEEMTPALTDETPVVQSMMDFAPQLETPSMGGSMSLSPMIHDAEQRVEARAEEAALEAKRMVSADDIRRTSDDLDEHGVPYGRTHHLERAVKAHQEVNQYHDESNPVPQPALPAAGLRAGEPSLRNADVTQPSTGIPSSHAPSSAVGGPSATQSGPFIDPFVTLETVTRAYQEDHYQSAPLAQRQEDGAPLGRSSHAERAKVARLMATQSLGLGMPRNPATAMGPPQLPARPAQRQFSMESEDGSEVPESEDGEEEEDLFAEKRTSFQPEPDAEVIGPLPTEKEEKRISVEKRALPKPPRPEPVRIPSPIGRIQAAQEEVRTDATNRFTLSLPFTLPSIGSTSPLLSSPMFSKDSAPSTADTQPSPPVTPVAAATPRRDTRSVEDRLSQAMRKMDVGPGRLELEPPAQITTTFRSTSDAFRMVEAALPPLPASDPAPKLPPGQIRQRISKDMIRQKMEERKQQEAASQTSSPMKVAAASESTAPQTPSKDKALPPPPPSEASWMASLFSKSEAEVGEDTGRTDRPPITPTRSHNRSAEDVLREAAQGGNMAAPKSALDRLVADLRPEDSTHSTPEKEKEKITKLGESASKAPEVTPNKTSGSRRIKRRSLSSDDIRNERAPAQRMSILGMGMGLDDFKVASGLGSLAEELDNIASNRPYRIHEQRQTVYASATDKVQTTGAGDTDTGKAWRQLRRPSDMNQYAKELKALKAKQAGMAKATGTIFVKIMGIEGLNLPIPGQPTAFCVTLDNGIDYIRTPYSTLAQSVKINQEFALVEHANFEFTLGLEIRRDPHVVQMLHSNMHKTVAPPASDASSMASTSRSVTGFRNMFSSPKKASKAPKSLLQQAAMASVEQPENICHYFSTGDSTVGKTHIAFKPIAKNCDARLLEIRYPMSGYCKREKTAAVASRDAKDHRGLPEPPIEAGPVKKQICKVTLQIFRLPPLPGLTEDQLPQSIDECLRGMRHHAWHEHEYYEGVLTQRGGDCSAPRRRMFKIIGSNLVASNSVTKKTVASIDLRKAVELVDENLERDAKMRQSVEEEDERLDRMPRSFTLVFDDGDRITFWTDNDLEKGGWMEALKTLIGKIPSNPLWAEMLAARLRHHRQRAASSGKAGSDAGDKA